MEGNRSCVLSSNPVPTIKYYFYMFIFDVISDTIDCGKMLTDLLPSLEQYINTNDIFCESKRLNYSCNLEVSIIVFSSIMFMWY